MGRNDSARKSLLALMSGQDNELEAFKKNLLSTAMACELCGVLADTRGVFVPFVPEEFGGVNGKWRYVGYGICTQCLRHSDATERAEAKLKERLRTK